MADNPKLVWVFPTQRGQMPNGVWTDEGGAPFQVAETAVSKSWQKRVEKDEAAELDKAKAAADKAQRAKSPGVAELSKQIAALEAERDELKAQVEALTAKPKAPPSTASATLASGMKDAKG